MHNKRRSYSSNGSSKRGGNSFAWFGRSRRRDLERDELRSLVVASAEKYVGHKARPGGLSDFGRRTGYQGHEIPWSGSFVDCVFRDARIFVPSCIYTPAGLGEFSADGRLFQEPELGDVVFYSYPTVTTFGMPHVGVVVDVSRWGSSKTFVAVEGQVDMSVVKAVRSNEQVIGFGRPIFERRPGSKQLQTDSLVRVDPSRVHLGSRGADVMNVQIALKRIGYLSDGLYSPAVFDAATRRAFARWQRVSGHVGSDADGVPSPASLESLGFVSGIFVIS